MLNRTRCCSKNNKKSIQKNNPIKSTLTQKNNSIQSSLTQKNNPIQPIIHSRLSITSHTASPSTGGPSACCCTRCWWANPRSTAKTRRSCSRPSPITTSLTPRRFPERLRRFARDCSPRTR